VADQRTIRNLSIGVWVVAALILVGIAFVRAPQTQSVSNLAKTGAPLSGARPVVYEFSTET
jgi:hypothetical protein